MHNNKRLLHKLLCSSLFDYINIFVVTNKKVCYNKNIA